MHRFTMVLTLLLILFIASIGSTPSAKADSGFFGYVCVSSFTNSAAAFPYTTTYTHPPIGNSGPVCNSKFAWGYTESAATGHAIWNIGGGGYTCSLDVYIPDTYATAQNAQYFIFDGQSYLANVTVNQNAYNNQRVSLGQYNFSSGAVVKLSDKQSNGVVGAQIAATAIYVSCSS